MKDIVYIILYNLYFSAQKNEALFARNAILHYNAVCNNKETMISIQNVCFVVVVFNELFIVSNKCALSFICKKCC